MHVVPAALGAPTPAGAREVAPQLFDEVALEDVPVEVSQ
jgi:hypothetical protein